MKFAQFCGFMQKIEQHSCPLSELPLECKEFNGLWMPGQAYIIIIIIFIRTKGTIVR